MPDRPPRASSARRSAWAGAALCVGAALAFGPAGTTAFWTDRATVPGGTFTSGTLDLLLDGTLAGPGGTWTNTELRIADLRPGEGQADDFGVGNGGTAPLVYRATAVASGDLAPHLRFSVATGASAVNQVDGQGNRVGSCQGGSPHLTDGTLGADPAVVIGADQSLAAGAAQVVCVSVRLVPTAPSTAQGQSATARFDFAARQPGAPP